MLCSAIVTKMAETEIDYMIDQLVETKVRVMLCCSVVINTKTLILYLILPSKTNYFDFA